MSPDESEKLPEGWEPIAKGLRSFPIPPTNPLFVQRVLAKLREGETRLSWRELWKIPALGFALAASLFAMITFLSHPSGSLENYLLAEVQDPMVSAWVSNSDLSTEPTEDQMLEFAMEDL